MAMSSLQATDPGQTSLLDHAVSNPSEPDITQSRSSFARAQTGFRRFSVARRKTLGSGEDTWGPYGLNLLYDPPDPLVDLIFVHGLRGGSVKTWCKGGDIRYFWPQAWLPREPDLQNARVHSFGYNADWADTKETTLDLHDFGRALLAEMNTSPFMRKAKSPIILVGHSMGGLVIKKAYILAQQGDPRNSLATRIQCMFFLATPHRGSDSAKMLNNILRASTVFSSRQYIADVFKGSQTLQIVNDEFRAFADRVQLWSFYESLKTRTSATSSVLVVDRDSAILGYKGEVLQPLNADHRGVCKFDSPNDPNYVTIRNSLSKAVEELLGDTFQQKTEEAKTQIRNIESFLMISYEAEDDLLAAEGSKTDGTCDWMINLKSFQDWRDSPSDSPLFYWLTGEPGSGKTVLAAHIIRHLQNAGLDVCFHFFHYGRKAHQTISGLLRQIAYQMMLQHPSVRHRLSLMQETGVRYDKDDERMVWRKFFMSEIFNLPLQRPQFWIVDGLDECVDAPKLFALLAKFDPVYPIRFCFIGRKRPDFDRPLSRFEHRLFTHHLDSSQTLQDISAYIRDNATMLPVDEGENGALIDRIVSKSRGIFLWAKLALEELEKAYSDESVDDILDEMPEGMASIYGRILDMMTTNTREIKLTKAILTWVICGARSLRIPEMQACLKLDLAMNIRSVERSVEGLCGQLLKIDKTGAIDAIHSTVRDFILDRDLTSPLAIRKDEGHERLALVCLQYLVSDEMKPPRNQLLVEVRAGTHSAFADYACTMFSEHVIRASAESHQILLLLDRFFQNNVLSWIEFIARDKRDLFHIIRTARNLRQYLERRAKYASPLGDQYRCIEQWATDLIRIVAKFSRNILRFPSTVFYLIAPLCPADSAISRQFNDPKSGFKLHGTGHTGWDDCVSYIDYKGVRASSLASGDNVFAIGQRTGHIKIYDAATCQEKADWINGGPVRFLRFDNTSQHLLAYGSHRLTLFAKDGGVLWTRDHDDGIAAAAFSTTDDVVIIATNDSSILHLSASSGMALPSNSLGREDCRKMKAATQQAILHADISPDLRIIAIAYRGRPVQIWSLERDILVSVCWLRRDIPGAPCMSVSQVLLNRNPAVELLAVTYQDGELAIFNPWTGKEMVSVSGDAYTLACSPDGRTLATGNMRGAIKLWDFDTLTCLYYIKSDDWQVRSMAFSSDGFRLYDIRAAKTKVWEPSALVRKSLSDESSTSGSVVPPVTVVDRGREITEIMSVAAIGNEHSVLVGREDGSVLLFDTTTGKTQKTLYSHESHIFVAHATCSAAGYVATAGLSSNVHVYAISKDADNAIQASQKVMEIDISEPIKKLALSPDGSKLMLCGKDFSSIYWIPNPGDKQGLSVPVPQGAEASNVNPAWAWLPQPLTGLEVAMVTDSALHLYETEIAAKNCPRKVKATLTVDGDPVPGLLQRIAFNQTSRFLALDFEDSKQSTATTTHKVLVYCLDQLAKGHSAAADANVDDSMLVLEPSLCLRSNIVRTFIGWHDCAIVYLDTDLWICSIDLGSMKRDKNTTTYTRTRHLFIPYELIGSSNGVAPVLASGPSIVFPRAGSLSIVENPFSSIFMTDEITG